MCVDPVSILGFALSAASTMAQFGAQQQAADAQTARYNQNYQNALAAGRDDHNQLTLRAMQEQEATAQKDHSIIVEGAEKAAEVSVSAAGGNVSGLSVDALLGDVARKTAMNRATVQRNAEMTAAQLQMEQRGVVAKEQARINSMAPGVDPNPLEPALKIAGSGIKLFSDVNVRT